MEINTEELQIFGIYIGKGGHMSKYIEFHTRERLNKKTLDVYVLTKGKTILGVIKWKPSFRKYALFPEYLTVFSEDCLQDIQDEIKRLNGGINVKA